MQLTPTIPFALALAFAGCSSSHRDAEPTTRGSTVDESDEGAAESQRRDEPAPAEDHPGGEIVVLARVVDSGPIGTGACHQCSHQIVVEQRLAGDLGADELWVHHEVCGAAPAPAPGTVAPCSLRHGVRYELRLRRGASPNFGSDPMILSAREH